MYAALYIPRFALQSTLRAQAISSSTPVALVSDGETRALVQQLTRAAINEGVEEGLNVAQALARCSELKIVYRSAQAESAAWQVVHSAAYSLSPRVEHVSEGVVLVDLRGRAVSEAKSECVEIVSDLLVLGLIVRVGIAPAYSTALLAAKQSTGVLAVGLKPDEGDDQIDYLSNQSFLDELPIGAAEPSVALLEVLQKWGLRTVGAFAALKRASVASRLGMEGLVLWDRVNGRETRVIAVVDLPKVFEVSWEFENEIDSLEPLLFLMRRFLEQLCFEMRAAHKMASVIVLELGLSYGEPLFIEQKMPEPSCDLEAFFRVLSGRLENLEIDAALDRFAIRIDVVDFKERQYGLFDSSLKNPSRFGQTLAKIAGIVGSDRVGRPVLHEDGRPDGVYLQEMGASIPLATERSFASHYATPLRRFRPAIQASVELQGSKPVWLQCARFSGFAQGSQGPWVHSGHWWESESSWNRVEWDIELRGGGVYRVVREHGQWFVEGEYD